MFITTVYLIIIPNEQKLYRSIDKYDINNITLDKYFIKKRLKRIVF